MYEFLENNKRNIIMMNKQLIAFTRKKVYVSNTNPVNWTEERKTKLITLTKELGDLGYTLSPRAILLLSDEDMVDIFQTVLPLAAQDAYPSGKWSPLYPGFPEQVLSLTEKELWENQRKLYETLDYDEFLKENPWYTDNEKKIISKVLPGGERELDAMTEDDVLAVFKSILASGNSIAETTKEELVYLLGQYPDYKLPEDIPFKETLCIVMSMRPDYKPKTVNDVLRYGLYIMGADPALLRVPKTKKETSWRNAKIVPNTEWRKLKTLPRSSRRTLMATIESVIAEKGLAPSIIDAKRFYGHWLLLSERLHPGEYKNYPLTTEFFASLKNNETKKTYKTWYSILQEKYNQGEDIVDIAKFVAKRPGELVRRFDSLIRRADLTGKEYDIFNIFLETEGMKNKTLTELLGYYDKRNSGASRLVSIKGHRSKKSLTPLQPLSVDLVNTIREFIERKILINIDKAVTEKDLLGKNVYLDPALKNIPIPVGMRTNIGVVPAGTRIPIGDKQFIRMFIHWIQKPGRNEDLDLHAYLYKDERTVRNIGFNTGLKSGDAVVHSGDVLNKPGDCSEFVDIDIQKALKQGWKYVVMDVCNYKGRPLNTLDNWLGYITYNDVFPSRNPNWIPPKNVDFSKKIDVDDSSMAAWIFDLEKKEAIFIGAGMSNMPINSGTQNQDLVKFYAVESSFTTYNVLLQHYISRGATILDGSEDAEVVPDLTVTSDDILHDYTKVLEILG